jgi:hypothetical protein
MAMKASSLAVPVSDKAEKSKRQGNMKTTKEKPILSVLAVPDESSCSCYSGLLRCSVVVRDNQYLMYYDGTERPVLRADKQPTLKIFPKYYIFDVSQVQQGCNRVSLDKDSSHYIGKIQRDKNLDVHAFSLHPKRDTIDSQQSLYVLYNILPCDWVKILLGDEPPRKAQVALYSENNDTRSRGNTLAKSVSSCMKESNSLLRIAHPDSGLHVLSNKPPYRNRNGDFALNFFGRCHSSNPANMQLQDKDGRVILQLAQSKRNTFNLDFRYVLPLLNEIQCQHTTNRKTHVTSLSAIFYFFQCSIQCISSIWVCDCPAR